MFFHVNSELAEFASRARSLKLKFDLYAMNLQQLAPMMQAAKATGTSGLAFDRIDTSGVLDTLGVVEMFRSLGHHLKKSNPHSTFFMYSMNWRAKVSEAGTPEDVKSPAAKLAMSKLFKHADVVSNLRALPDRPFDHRVLQAIKGMDKTPQSIRLPPFTVLRNYWACFDLESKFNEFREQQRVNAVCRSVGLKER